MLHFRCISRENISIISPQEGAIFTCTYFSRQNFPELANTCKHPRPTVHHTPGSSRTQHHWPRVSDHDHLVIADTSLKATINAKRPRNIQLFNKADWDKIRNDLNTFEESFFTGTPSNNTVDQNWGSFKTTVLNAINKWVPTKKSKSKSRFPLRQKRPRFRARKLH